jgi:hypothetical protein
MAVVDVQIVGLVARGPVLPVLLLVEVPEASPQVVAAAAAEVVVVTVVVVHAWVVVVGLVLLLNQRG